MRFFCVQTTFILIAVTAFISFSPVAANAQSAKDSLNSSSGISSGISSANSVESATSLKQKRLDDLFGSLANEAKAPSAKRISDKIWDEWLDSGSKSIDLLMSQARKAVGTQKEGFALDVLDQVITLAPEFAEGWNFRATVHYKKKDFGRSLADIEQTLKLEPRHFGALAGLAAILNQLGKQEKALQTWQKVLEIYPANAAAQKEVIRLVEATFGEKV
ncbi:MAG: tetratricopeptide repeat protein [Nitratireductor sp.]